MVHPQIKSGWHEISVQWPPRKKDNKPDHDMFIGRFQNDQQYHLLGYRPQEIRYMFSANSESNQDLGIVILPKGKKSLTELAEGETFQVKPQGNSQKSYRVKYIKHN